MDGRLLIIIMGERKKEFAFFKSSIISFNCSIVFSLFVLYYNKKNEKNLGGK